MLVMLEYRRCCVEFRCISLLTFDLKVLREIGKLVFRSGLVMCEIFV